MSASSADLRVMVVDDHPDIACSMQMLLNCLGHEAEVARNGYVALDRLAAYRPDVVLLDLGLPGIDGFDVARRIRATAGGDKVFLVACTGYGSAEDRMRSRDAGFDLHLTKPVGVDALVGALAMAGSCASRARRS